MFVKTILDEKGPELIRVSQIDAVRDVARLFKVERIGFAVVEDVAKVPVGTISERDIVQALAVHEGIGHLKVAEIMTQKMVSVAPDEALETVRQIMTEQRTRHVLVKQAGKLVGVVSIGDLVKHSLAECQVDTDQMRDYIGGRGYQ